jgi:tetratricopeptide (TPR) repeat protein
MALLLLEIGRENRAADMLEEAAIALPDNPAVRETYGHVLFRLNRHEDASNEYEAALSLLEADGRSASPFLRIQYATALQRAGRTEEAARQVQRAMEEDAEMLNAYFHYAMSAGGADNAESVRSVLSLLREQRSDDPTTAMLQGVWYAQQNLDEQALPYYREAEALYEDSSNGNQNAPARFYFWFGAALERTGNLEEADRYFQRCIEIDPNFAEAYNYIAYMWAEQGAQLDRAESLVRKALELDPGNGAFLDTLGWVYYHQGRMEAALEKLMEAAAVEPDDPTILDHIGDALIALGRPALARDYWRRALEADPENETIREKLDAAPEGPGLDDEKPHDPDAIPDSTIRE